MNYTGKDLTEITRWPGKEQYLLVWNDHDGIQPRKLLVTGMCIGDHPWIVPIRLQDGVEDFYFQHAAEVPADWTPYENPREIPFFDAEVGKQYRVVGNCGMDFDRIMYCVRMNPEGYPLFGNTMDDKKCIGTAWIDHVYTT